MANTDEEKNADGTIEVAAPEAASVKDAPSAEITNATASETTAEDEVQPKKKRSRKKIAAVVVGILVVLVVGVVGFAGNFLFDFALNPNASYTMKSMMEGGDVSGFSNIDTAEVPYASEATTWFDEKREHVLITASTDDIDLSGWLFSATESDGSTSHDYAIVMHGYTGTPESMETYGYRLYQRNMNVLMPAARGHELSGGDYMGMGWPDRNDIVDWINYIVEQDPEANIMLLGVSMGGATAMNVAGMDLPSNVKCIVEDAGFTSVWDQFSTQLQNVFGVPSFPLLNSASLFCQIRAGWSFEEANAIESLNNATVPMLFIHGSEDTFVPVAGVDTAYDACGSEVKEKLIVEGAGHGLAAIEDPELYWETVYAFLDENFS